ncbi:transglutaminase family protein [Georgenia sp. SUBG003]|uniref:transglutaminase family protein n=1 Tax=Georgenia sp. SUBG003 TaxID=1497974 RepID=UPI003AB5A8D2
MSRRRDAGGGGHRHYRLVHRSTYSYPAPATSSYGRAMLLPRDGAGQRVHRASLAVSPEPAEQAEHVDPGGNRSDYFHVASEHTVLEVEASSLVTVTRRRVDGSTLPQVPWERVVASVSGMRATGRGEHGEGPSSVMAIVESALASELAAPDEQVLEYALPSFRPGAPLVPVVADLAHRVHEDLAHRPGTTAEPAALTDVLAARTGTSQDLAHLTIAGLRALGLSARYVSGYVDTTPPPGYERLRGTGTVHGWVAVWVPGGGWLHVDPANDVLVDERHVVLGWGRDAGDVAPLRGIAYSAGDGAEVDVAVALEPLTAEELDDALHG